MLGEHLNKFVMAYLNDIIIYLNIIEEYKKHIKQVLKKFYKEDVKRDIPNSGIIIQELLIIVQKQVVAMTLLY